MTAVAIAAVWLVALFHLCDFLAEPGKLPHQKLSVARRSAFRASVLAGAAFVLTVAWLA